MYRKDPNDLLPEPVSGPLRAVYQPAEPQTSDRLASDRLEALLRQIRQKYASRPNSELRVRIN